MLRIQQLNRFRYLCKRPFTVSLKRAKSIEVTPDVALEEESVVNVMSFEEKPTHKYGKKYRDLVSEEVSFI